MTNIDMPFDDDESVPAAKLKEIENEKVVIEPKTKKEDVQHYEDSKKNKFHLYMYISEGILLLTTFLAFAFALADFSFFFDTYQYGSFDYLDLQLWTLLLIIPVSAFALINTYFFIFKLHPKYRTYLFIIRFAIIVVIITSFILALIHTGYYYDITDIGFSYGLGLLN